MSISDLLLLPFSSAIRRRSVGVLEALTIHLILSCTWFCNGSFEQYSTKRLPMNMDYNIYVIYEDPHNASFREPFTSDLDPQCLNVNQMSYMGLSNACYRFDLLCSQLQSSRLKPEDRRSREAEAAPKSSEIGSFLKRVREEPSESLKSDMINLDASSFSLPVLVDVKPHLLDWGTAYLHSHNLAFLVLTNRQKDRVLHVFKPTITDNQFYVCNYSGSLLDAGERISICLIFHRKRLGLSSAHLVIQTSLGGFMIQVQGMGFAVNHPVENEIIEMARVPLSGWWSSLFSSISLTVYAIEFKSSVPGLMHGMFKKILCGLGMKKIYAVTFIVVSMMFLRHCSTTPHKMQWLSNTYLFLGCNDLMPTVGSVGNSTSVNRNQKVSGLSIFHKMDVRHSLKKKNRSLVMGYSDNTSGVSQCGKLEPMIYSVDNMSRENKKRESAASPVTESVVVLTAENGDSANLGAIAVKVGKEKRKKKRRTGQRNGAAVSINSPGSQSGYSTPPTPMSPVTTVLLPSQSIWSAKSKKHRDSRSPTKTMTSHFSVKSVSKEKSLMENDKNLSVPKTLLADAPKQTLNEPVLGSSGNFPAVDYPQKYIYPPYFLPPSAIAPNARAPGPKLCRTSEKVALVKEEAVSDFTYNLWGYSFFGFDRIGRPKEVKEPSVISFGNNSESFSFFTEGPALVESIQDM